LTGDYSPTGDELEAAALHAARRVERHERSAREWGEELSRLLALAKGEGLHPGLMGEAAAEAGVSRHTLGARLKAWRARNERAA
jgi:hypothetical protein